MKLFIYTLIIFIGLYIGSAFEITARAEDNLTSADRINYDPKYPAVPGEILVKFKPATFSGNLIKLNGTVQTSQESTNEIFIQLRVNDVKPVFRTTQTPTGDIYRLRFASPLLLSNALEKMAEDPNVEWVQPNYLYRTSVTPNDNYFPDQWGLEKIQAEQAWDISPGDPGIIIAVIDTGVDYDHLDLEDNIWHNPGEPLPYNGVDDDGNGYVDDDIGWDFVDGANGYPGEDDEDEDNDPMDFDGHGTGCSGIASAVTNNSIGIAGTTWNCKIMALRAGYKGDDGNGWLADSDTAAALHYAADNGAHMISMSWSGGGSPTLLSAINYAYDAGCVLVAAAGNDNTDDPYYPAAYDNVIGVAASDEDDDRASFSNYGWWVDLAAPGRLIHGTTFNSDEHNDTYSLWSGTSMSTPIVAGVAALILSHDTALTNDAVRQRLIDSADDIGWAIRVNAYNALNSGSAPDPPSNLSATPISSTQIDLAWDDVGGENGYEIQRREEGGDFQQIDTTASNVSNYSDTALQPETNHTYRVRAYNGAGNSDWSNEATAMTPANSSPDVSGIPDVSFDEDESDSSIDLDNYVTDLDHTPAEMTWTYSGNTDVNVDIDPATHIVTFTAPSNWNGNNDITFTATDPGGSSDSYTVTVTVNPVNDPPVIAPIPDVSFDEDGSNSEIDLDDYVDDIDNNDDDMTWTYSGNTDVNVGIDPATHVVTFSATANWNGSENITFTATDPGGLSDSDTITVTVNPINDSPVLAPIPDISFDEDGSHSEIDLDNYVDDIDNTDDDMTWTYSGNTDVNVSIDSSASHIVTFTAPTNWNGSNDIAFTATDPGGLSDNDTITVTVNPVNDAPVVNIPPDVSFDEDGSDNIDLDDYVTDPDNTSAEMTWTYTGNIDVNVAINPTTHIATFTVPADWNGSNDITFTATDPGGLSDSDTITIIVNPINDAPVVAPIPDVSFGEGGSHNEIDLDDYVDDIDNTDDDMIWTYSGDTDVIVSINSSASHIVTFTAPANWNGSNDITFTATDPGGLSDSDTMTVTVNPVNDAPLVNITSNVSFDEDGSETIDLDDYVTDPDNTSAEMTWTYAGNTDVIVNINTTTHVATFTTPINWNGAENITFTATDPGGSSDSDTLTVTVNPVNDAPELDPVPDVSFNEDESGTIDLDDYATDPDNTLAEMTWTYAGNTNVGVAINPTTHIATFTAPANWNGSNNITFTATDPGGLSDNDTITVTVVPVNDAPVLGTIPDVEFDEDRSHSEIDLDDYVSDIDNSDDDMTWTYSGNTDVNVSINPSASHIVTFTAPANWNGSNDITFTVTDPGGLSDSDTMTVTVNPVNDAPTIDDLTILPLPPELGDDLNASYTYNDIDGGTEVIVEIKWYKDGVHQPYDGMLTIPSSATSLGQVWYLTARASDGIDTGDLETSPSVVIDGLAQEIHLYPGRNLISLYADVANTDLLSVLAPIEELYTSVSAYDAGSGKWKQYAPGALYTLNDLRTIEYGNGYIINMIAEASFTIVAERIDDTSIFLHRGWNLVGYNSAIARLRADALLSIEGLYFYIWTYDRSADKWRKYVVDGSQIDNNLIQLEPGMAYWIYVGQDCTWTLPPE